MGFDVEKFIKEIEQEEKRRIAMIENQIKKGCDKCSQWDEYFGCDKCERI